jgi:transposase-like protein
MADAMFEARTEGTTYRRVEMITGRRRRQNWPAREKARIVVESLDPEAACERGSRVCSASNRTPSITTMKVLGDRGDGDATQRDQRRPCAEPRRVEPFLRRHEALSVLLVKAVADSPTPFTQPRGMLFADKNHSLDEFSQTPR